MKKSVLIGISKVKNKKVFLILSSFFLVFLIGGTVAYYNNLFVFSDAIDTSEFASSVDGNFTSPDGWEPGNTTTKTYVVSNDGDVALKTRVKIVEEWTSKNGDTLPNVLSNGEHVAIINYHDTNKWVAKDCGGETYFVYTDVLEPEDETETLIDSVTFNPGVSTEYSCTTTYTNSDQPKIKCTSSGDYYDGASYTLTFNTQTVQSNVADTTWGSCTTSKYVINFDGNEATSGMTNSKNCTYGENCTLTTNGYTKTGSTFLGWSNTPSGEVIYDDQDTVKNLVPDGIVTLYAVWAPYGTNSFYNLFRLAYNAGDALLYTGDGASSYQNKVYYYKGNVSNNHVIFGGFCWRTFRTTETGGVKMIYDGAPVDGKCESTRADQTGINGSYTTKDLGASYKYGTRFTVSGTTFTLSGTTKTGTYSEGNYTQYQGLYTCMNTTGECTTLYHVNAHTTDSTSFVTEYTVGSTVYSDIGASPYNSDYITASGVGYMYNTVYNRSTTAPSSGALFGSGVSYNDDTEMYTLTGTGSSLATGRHYTCDNDTGTCANVRYYYYMGSPEGNLIYRYITLTKGKEIDDAIEEMLHDSNVNVYDSDVKTLVETWYSNNLTSFTNKLEDTVYCNDRTIGSLGAWAPTGSMTAYLSFNTYSRTATLVCANDTDKFTVSNSNGNGKLSYPIGLLTEDERMLTTGEGNPFTWMRDYTLLASPSYIHFYYARTCLVGSAGDRINGRVDNAYGVRPVVSLKLGTTYSSGNGSETSPYIVD